MPVTLPTHEGNGGGRADLAALLLPKRASIGVPVHLLVFAELTEDGLNPLALPEATIDGEQTYALGQLADRLVDRLASGLPGAALPGRVTGLDPDLFGVAVRSGPSLVGVLVGSAPRRLERAELRSLATAAEQAATGLLRVAASIRLGDLERQSELLVDISRSVTQSPQLPSLVPQIAAGAARAALFDRATVILASPDGTLSIAGSQFAGGQPDDRVWGALRAMPEPLPAVRAVLETGEPALFERPENATSLDPAAWIRPYGVRSALIVPMQLDEERVGVILLDSGTRAPIGPERVRAAMRVADQGAAALATVREIQAGRAALQRAQLVLGTVVQAATQLNASGVLTVIGEGINRVLDDDTTVSFVVEGERPGRLVVCGQGDGALALVERVVAEGADGALVGPDDDYLAFDRRSSLLAGVGANRGLAVPLRRASRELGWVVSYGSSPEGYTADDLRIVSGIAVQASLSLHTSLLLEGERATVSRLEELDRLKTAFVAAVSHELRTPLTAIVGYAEILSERIEDPRLASYLEDMRRESAVLEALIGNLLDSSKLEAGMLQLSLADVQLRPILEDAIAVVRHSYPERTMDLEIPAGLESVPGDRDRLRQIFVNLIENAAKYSPEDSRIEVAARAAEDVVIVTVDDEGSGIPVEHREAIFQRFARLSEGREKPGTGIGLYLVRALVEAHGGSVTATDPPGGTGTRFEVRLPRGQ